MKKRKKIKMGFVGKAAKGKSYSGKSSEQKFGEELSELFRVAAKKKNKASLISIINRTDLQLKESLKTASAYNKSSKKKLAEMLAMDKSNPAKKGKYGKYFHTIPELKALIKKSEATEQTFIDFRDMLKQVLFIVKNTNLIP